MKPVGNRPINPCSDNRRIVHFHPPTKRKEHGRRDDVAEDLDTFGGLTLLHASRPGKMTTGASMSLPGDYVDRAMNKAVPVPVR